MYVYPDTDTCTPFSLGLDTKVADVARDTPFDGITNTDQQTTQRYKLVKEFYSLI